MAKVVLDTVTICNMALRHLGQTKGLESFDDDETEAADGCRIFYPQVLDEVLSEFPWPFATKTDSLILVSDPTIPPTPEWAYAYRYPVDAIWIRRILPPTEQLLPNFAGFPTSTGGLGMGPWPGSRQETQSTRVKYRIARDDSGLLIYTDFPPVDATDTTAALPLCEYIMQQDDSAFYPAMFGQAMAWKLAFYLAPSLTLGDKFKLGDRAMVQYTSTIARAQAGAINEEQPDQLPEAEWIQAR